jgi:hypothetical protein
LRARRRLLGMLLALAVASGVLAGMQLAAWWVMLPPTVMLLGYVGLLREASKADAERRSVAAERESVAAEREVVRQQSPDVARSATAKTPAAAPVAVAVPAPAVPPVPVVPPAPAAVAEVIDITARVSDDLFDQYTDGRRAVGAN